MKKKIIKIKDHINIYSYIKIYLTYYLSTSKIKKIQIYGSRQKKKKKHICKLSNKST